jgi:protein-S-isoprenylcysteine O-methyltransferase Ste14
MADLRDLTTMGAGWAADLVGMFWLLAAAWFAVRWPGSAGQKLRHLVVTLLPEPWVLVLVPVYVAVLVLVPHGVWTALRYWDPVVGVVGLAVTVAGAALMIWARVVLGIMWAGRPMLQDQHELCTRGAYRLVRHPIYTGLLAMGLGGAVAAGLGTTLVLVAGLVALVAWRVPVEERMMVTTFGDRYRDYRRRVPALVPFTARSA